METPMATSVSSKKTSAAVLFTLEGMELTLFQDTEVLICDLDLNCLCLRGLNVYNSNTEKHKKKPD